MTAVRHRPDTHAAKPAPTAAEIKAAREWLSDPDKPNVGPRSRVCIDVLLSALDAAEARAAAAEKYAKVNEKFYIDTCASLSKERTRALTAEKERDEARAALKPFAECWRNFKAAPVDDKRHPRLDPIACGFDVWRNAAEVAKEEPRG